MIPPNRPALVAADGTMHYDDLDLASHAVAGALLGADADLGESRVAYFVPPSGLHVAVQRGIWRAGGVAVPMAMSHPDAELEYVLRDAEPAAVVVARASADRLARLVAPTGARLLIAEEAAATRSERALPHVGAPRRALMLYTSGTTGKPKGVVTTHANIGAQVSALVEAWRFTPSDRVLHVLPLHHVHGIINALCAPLAVRATCEMLTSFDAELVWSRLASGEVTVFTAVPTVYHRLIAAWEATAEDVRTRWSEGAGRLRLMMSGSAALPVQTLERWRAVTGHTLLERYGMTELGMALSNPLDGERRPGFVGLPLPGVDAQLVDEGGRVVETGTPGELEIRGANVFKEYWRRPQDTADAFRNGWFRTGDMAVVEEGAYRLLGRTSVDIIKTGGYKVSALEIEEVLRTHPAIAECAVVGVTDGEWGERVSAAVELAAGASLSLDDMIAWGKTRLAPYKVPRALKTVEALPRNAMGKVVKPEVAALFAAR